MIWPFSEAAIRASASSAWCASSTAFVVTILKREPGGNWASFSLKLATPSPEYQPSVIQLRLGPPAHVQREFATSQHLQSAIEFVLHRRTRQLLETLDRRRIGKPRLPKRNARQAPVPGRCPGRRRTCSAAGAAARRACPSTADGASPASPTRHSPPPPTHSAAMLGLHRAPPRRWIIKLLNGQLPHLRHAHY